MYELTQPSTTVGSGTNAGIQVPATMPSHALVRHRRDGQLEFELTEEAMSMPDSIHVDGAVSTRGMLVHGATLRVRGTVFQAIDLTVADPSGQFLTVRKRLTPAVLGHVTFADRLFPNTQPLTTPLTLVGSSEACDLVIPRAPSICAGIWLRGDGEIELVEIDMSVLPYGQPIIGGRLLGHLHGIKIGPEDGLVLTDPPEQSKLEEKPLADSLKLATNPPPGFDDGCFARADEPRQAPAGADLDGARRFPRAGPWLVRDRLGPSRHRQLAQGRPRPPRIPIRRSPQASQLTRPAPLRSRRPRPPHQASNLPARWGTSPSTSP